MCLYSALFLLLNYKNYKLQAFQFTTPSKLRKNEKLKYSVRLFAVTTTYAKLQF